MKKIVLKFGGVILSNKTMRLRAVDQVHKFYSKGYVPIVVVSALGRYGDPYSTDTLIHLTKEINNKVEPRELDLIMSCGEIISSVLFHTELMNLDIPSIALTGGQAGIITDDNFSNAAVIKLDEQNLLNIINKGTVPIISGFQGETEDKEITTLGRGTSDYTASLLGAKLKAEKILIFKDVDGLMSADPKIVTDARNIKHISYEDVFQMAEFGAKVIHPLAVETAMKAGIPIILKNIMDDDKYTLIDKTKSDELISAVTYMSNRVQYIIDNTGKVSKNMAGKIFKNLANHGISIDLISILPDRKIFTVDNGSSRVTSDILKQYSLNYHKQDHLVKVSVIGCRMRGVPGIMAKIIRSFSENGIEILQTADSHNSISCLVKEKDYEKAVKLLYNIFRV